MIEPVTYLYYRCYKLYSRFNKENPPFQYGSLFGLIVWIVATAAVALVNNEFPSYSVIFILMFLSLGFMMIISHFEERIVKKYDNMDKQKKQRGNVVFIVELIIIIFSVIIIIRV